jgi:hypothetical protein
MPSHWLRWGLTNFLPVLAWNPNPPDLHLWVPRIIGLSHHTLLGIIFLGKEFLVQAVVHACNSTTSGREVLRWEDHKFKASLGCRARLSQKMKRILGQRTYIVLRLLIHISKVVLFIELWGKKEKRQLPPERASHLQRFVESQLTGLGLIKKMIKFRKGNFRFWYQVHMLAEDSRQSYHLRYNITHFYNI